MSAKTRSFCKPFLSVAIFCVLSTSTVMMRAQTASTQPASPQPVGVPDDWTHHHLVFSNPGSIADAVKNGTVEQWNKINNDSRFQMQQWKRDPTRRALAGALDFAARTAIVNAAAAAQAAAKKRRGTPEEPVKKDWNMDLGGNSGASLTAVVGTTINSGTLPSGSSFTFDARTFTASPPTAATQTGTFSSPPTSSNNSISVALGGNTINLSTNATAASSIGTFTGTPPLSTTTISLTSGGNTLNITPGGTAQQAIGTWAGPPLTTTPAITVTSGLNTLSMTTNATAQTETGTVVSAPLTSTSIALGSGFNTLTMKTSGTAQTETGTVSSPPTATTSIALSSGFNTLTMTNNGSAQTETGTVVTPPLSSTSLVLGSGFNTLTMTTNGVKGVYLGTVASPPTSSTSIGLNGGFDTLTMTLAAGAAAETDEITFNAPPLTTTSISFTSGFNKVTMTTNATQVHDVGTFSNSAQDNGTITITNSATGHTLTINVTSGVTGNNICTSSTTAQVEHGGTAGSYGNTEAANLNTALTSTSCTVTYPQGLTTSYTAGSNSITIIGATPGPYYTFGNGTSSNFSWAASTGGSAGSAACSGSAGTYTGTFATSSTLTTLAGNFNTAIGDCGLSSSFTNGYTSPNAFVTIANTPLGVPTLSTADSTYSWSRPTAGSNGAAPACGGSGTNLTGTYQTGSSAITVAGNLVTRIAACGGSAANLDLSTTNNNNGTFTITENFPGVTNFTTADSTFTWATTTAGTYGSNSCPGTTPPGYTGTFATSNTAALIATSLANAIQSCNTTDSLGLAVGNPTGQVTVAESIPGVPIFTSDATFSWAATVPGSNGSNSCPGTTKPTLTGTFATSTTAALVATSLYNAINSCNNTDGLGLTVTNPSGGTVRVVESVAGVPTFSSADSSFTWTVTTAGGNGGATVCGGSGTALTGTFATSNTASNVATNLANAISSCNTADSLGLTVTNPTSTTVQVAESIPGVPTFTSDATYTWAVTTAGSNGTGASCGGTGNTFSGNYQTGNSTTTVAGNLNTAIGMCSSASTGFTTSTTGATVTVTDTTPGTSAISNFSVGGGSSGVFTWGTVSAGSNGTTPTCTTGSSPFSATYITSNAANALATNFSNAIAQCAVADGFSDSPSGATVTVTDTILGTGTFSASANAAGIFSWGTASAGSNGGYTCTGTSSPFIATYATAATTAALASNLNSAISSCGATTLGITSTYSTGSSFTVSDGALGTQGNGTGAFSPTGTLPFHWASSGTFAGGTNGTDGTATFAYWSGSGYDTQAQLATDIATALVANTTINSTFTVVANFPATGDVLITDKTAGAGAGITLTTSPSGFTALTGGTLAGGATGGGTVGVGQFPAKYSFSTTSAGICAGQATPDYVIYNTGSAGVSGSHANIIAYDNIYSGCSGTVPTVYWSYYTGTGSVVTSPVLSGDGTKVAFIETPTSGAATLRILKWVGGQGTDYNHPVAPTHLYTNTYAGAAANTAWSTCPSGSSCLISVAFQTQLNRDTISSPWYDYLSDTLWVGDTGGYLHEFTGVFLGTPGESTNHASPGTCGTSCPWPAFLGTSSGPLTSPVYDNIHDVVFLGDFLGRFDAVTSAGVVLTPSSGIGQGASTDIDEAPLVDPSAGPGGVGTEYVFVTCDSTNSVSGTCDGSSAVDQFTGTTLSTYQGPAEVGTGSDTIRIYSGTFDNAYYTSGGTTPTGYLWVCGQAGGNPALYAVPITNGTMSPETVPVAATVSSATGTASTCSPVTEFYNGTDYVFVSPQNEGPTVEADATGCTANIGCVISYTISGATPTISGAGAFTGGASGMVIDTQNTTVSGTLQLYFGLLGNQSCSGAGGVGSGNGACAVQASQVAP